MYNGSNNFPPNHMNEILEVRDEYPRVSKYLRQNSQLHGI